MQLSNRPQHEQQRRHDRGIPGRADARQRRCNKPTSAWRPFLPVRASASVSPAIVLSPSGVVEFTVCQQSGIGRDHRAAKLQHQTAVEIELENLVV
jgi:hypothetical protein